MHLIPGYNRDGLIPFGLHGAGGYLGTRRADKVQEVS